MNVRYDNKVRVVSLNVLREMCENHSGMCHRYEVEKVSRSRATVSYSNPDEYGSETPAYIVFPVYPGYGDEPNVVLDCIRTYGGRPMDKIGTDLYQLFDGMLSQSFHFNKVTQKMEPSF